MWPTANALLMGCAWSLYAAQAAHRSLLSGPPSVRDSVWMSDQRRPLVSRSHFSGHGTYVASLGRMTGSTSEADNFAQTHEVCDCGLAREPCFNGLGSLAGRDGGGTRCTVQHGQESVVEIFLLLFPATSEYTQRAELWMSVREESETFWQVMVLALGEVAGASIRKAGMPR